MNVPNIVSISRIIMTIPVFILTVMGPDYKIAALVLFVIAALSDLFDGWYARKFNQITDLGKFLDQISDKILINTVFIALLGADIVPGWFVAIIVSRDIFVSGMRMFLASKNVVIAADKFGKLKTFLQIVSILYAYLFINEPVLISLLIFTAIVSVVSGINYYTKNKENIL
ncbi:MAG: CDP-diacylglycerol--glycerol-3-phosphate 3-phosphatidyltransferase [Thermotogota bacterium]